jgi:hypothetical protein
VRLAPPPDSKATYAWHSLRAGFATAAGRAGRSEPMIMRHRRWKSVQMAGRYIRQDARWAIIR